MTKQEMLSKAQKLFPMNLGKEDKDIVKAFHDAYDLSLNAEEDELDSALEVLWGNYRVITSDEYIRSKDDLDRQIGKEYANRMNWYIDEDIERFINWQKLAAMVYMDYSKVAVTDDDNIVLFDIDVNKEHDCKVFIKGQQV